MILRLPIRVIFFDENLDFVAKISTIDKIWIFEKKIWILDKNLDFLTKI